MCCVHSSMCRHDELTCSNQTIDVPPRLDNRWVAPSSPRPELHLQLLPASINASRCLSAAPDSGSRVSGTYSCHVNLAAADLLGPANSYLMVVRHSSQSQSPIQAASPATGWENHNDTPSVDAHQATPHKVTHEATLCIQVVLKSVGQLADLSRQMSGPVRCVQVSQHAPKLQPCLATNQ